MFYILTKSILGRQTFTLDVLFGADLYFWHFPIKNGGVIVILVVTSPYFLSWRGGLQCMRLKAARLMNSIRVNRPKGKGPCIRWENHSCNWHAH